MLGLCLRRSLKDREVERDGGGVAKAIRRGFRLGRKSATWLKTLEVVRSGRHGTCRKGRGSVAGGGGPC